MHDSEGEGAKQAQTSVGNGSISDEVEDASQYKEDIHR